MTIDGWIYDQCYDEDGRLTSAIFATAPPPNVADSIEPVTVTLEEEGEES